MWPDLIKLEYNITTMDTQHGNSEIIELVEDMNATSGKHIFVRHGQRFSIEDDINRLFESIDIKTSARKNLQKQAMKRPVRADSCQASRIGITESTSLKQALRGLCISQASEMAAMKRLLSKPPSLSRGISEAVTIKRLYKAVVVEANESCNSGRPIRDGKLVEVSLVPENAPIVETLELTACPSLPMHNNRKTSKMELGPRTNMNVKLSSISTHKKEKLPAVDEIVPTSGQERAESEFHYAASLSTFNPGTDSINSAGTGPKLLKSIFRRKNLAKKKSKIASTSIVNGNGRTDEKSSNDLGPSTSTSKKPKTKADEKSRVREKGEFSQSSKSSVAECSSSNTSFSYESSLSSSNRSGCRPHMSRDSRWEAVRCVQKQHGSLDLRHFKLLKKLGGGDIGTVYLAELIGGSKCLFGLKVMDNEFLAQREKISRAETEREILQVLDHPFLPTLFGHFTNDKYMCLVMEYCPGGDLHVIRQKQLNKHFSEQAARFYVAEILLALEYLHMLGVVYRDLKPENVLVREDGHIMLTDFDLSLRCAPNQTFLKPSSPIIENPKKSSNLCTNSSCITPFCLQPSWQVQCFTPRLKPDPAAQVSPLPQLVVEPTTARSNSYVGTHEYLAPEIIKGEGHGSPVDWWTFGILLYELLYGRTPFKGDGNEDTLVNVVSKCLKFPESPTVSSHAKDLIKGLLRKQPEDRLGSVKGAAEIKQHPFFEGMNWALIRCAAPPELPRTYDLRRTTTEMASLHSEGVMCEKEFTSTGQNSFFEMF